MPGINLSDLAQKRGLAPRMGLGEARGEAQRRYYEATEPFICEECGDGDLDSIFAQTIIILYGLCPDCLKASEKEK